MKTFKVPEMHCEHCVARINKALKGAGISHEVDLDKKTVTITDDTESTVKETVELLDDLGFTAE
jgi:copper chaperone